MSRHDARDDARMAVLEAARQYIERGWQSIPVPYRSKNPNRAGWQGERRTAADIDADFGTRLVNVGLLTGAPSGGLLDVDVDSAEALRLKEYFLPPTDAVFGRDGKPASHWLYLADEPGDIQQFKAPDGAMLVEYRSTGGQTIAPPSLTSEPVRWERDGEPSRVEAPLLLRQVARLAAASLLARSWPKTGGRHDASLALVGGLLRAGWTEDDAAEFVVAVAQAAGDEEAPDRADDVRTTARRIADGAPATGWATLRQSMGDKVVRKVRAWLGVQSDGSGTGDRAPNDTTDRQSGIPYEERGGRLYWRKPTRDGDTPVLLSNFTARIIGDVVTDDGADTRRAWEVEARLGERVARGTVAVERFAAMGWATELLGAGAVVAAGGSTRDHARAAIQLLSGSVVERRVYAHLGWRRIGDAWVYLHAGGAIGEDGPVDGVEIDVPAALSRFVLPEPPVGDRLNTAIRASLAMLDVASNSVTAPLFGAAYRAPLGANDGGVHLVGMTGAGKSELAALSQQHYGPGLDRTHLPASWSSTANSLEALAFVAKDALLVVDDFAPGGSQQDVLRYHRDADRLFRAQGNGAGRQRLRADSTLRAPKFPRGTILSTGEDVTRGQSARARVLNVDVPRDAVRFDLLTNFQHTAADGLPALAMAGYIRWLAARYDGIERAVRDAVIELRSSAQRSRVHRRTPELVANLAVGWHYWLQFAVEAAAITDAERGQIWRRIWRGIGEAASQQDAHQRAGDPTRRFFELLAGAVASGSAHVAAVDGRAPSAPTSWGWRERSLGVGDFVRDDWQPQGLRIGWIDEDGLFLEPEASFTAAQKFGMASGDPVAVGQRMLSRMLFERHLLVQSERDRDRYTVRRELDGRRRNVLYLRPDILEAPPSGRTAQTAQAAQAAPDDAAPIWSDADPGPFGRADSVEDEDGTAQDDGPEADSSQERTTHGRPFGPFGPFVETGDGQNGERFIGWRCTHCRALESLPGGDGRRCAGCGALTDDAGRVRCTVCAGPAEDGQKHRCLKCIDEAGGAA